METLSFKNHLPSLLQDLMARNPTAGLIWSLTLYIGEGYPTARNKDCGHVDVVECSQGLGWN